MFIIQIKVRAKKIDSAELKQNPHLLLKDSVILFKRVEHTVRRAATALL